MERSELRFKRRIVTMERGQKSSKGKRLVTTERGELRFKRIIVTMERGEAELLQSDGGGVPFVVERDV